MSGRKPKTRTEMEERIGVTQSQLHHRAGALHAQLEGCKSDEARRLIMHGIQPWSKHAQAKRKLPITRLSSKHIA